MSANQWAYLGWMMFTLSGVFFLIDALETGDKTAIGAAVTRLVGIVFFLVAMKDDSPEK